MNKDMEQIREMLNKEDNIIVKDKPEEFSRVIEFTALGYDYKFIWYVNESSVRTNNTEVISITNVNVITTWPSEHPRHLALYDVNNEIIGLINI